MVNIRGGARRGSVRRILRGLEGSTENTIPAESNNGGNVPVLNVQREAENVEAAANVGAAAGGENPMGAMLGMLAQILQRLPGVVQAEAPEAPVVVDVPRVAEPVVVNEEVPSYLKVMDHMQRLGTRFFVGGARPVEAEEWRSRLERNFRSIRCPELYQIDLAVHYLEGDAHTWWGSVVARRNVAEMSWNDFVEEFNAKYFPQEAQDRLEGEFFDLVQGNRTVREYEIEFNRLKKYGGHGLDDEKVHVRRFLRGMRAELRNRCIVISYASVNELVERAALIEEGLKDENKMVNSSFQPKKHHSSGQSKGGKSDRGQKRKWEDTPKTPTGNKCFRCGSKDHLMPNCPKPENRTCFHCNEVGHIKTKCPKLQKESGKGGSQPAGRAMVTPRVYSLGIEEGGSSNPSPKPITGKN